MAETCGIAMLIEFREETEEAIRRGVPREAAEGFVDGHVKVVPGIVFGRVGFPLSDGAKLLAGVEREKLFRPDWKKLFDPQSVKEQVEAIVRGQPGPNWNRVRLLLRSQHLPGLARRPGARTVPRTGSSPDRHRQVAAQD
jgi:hypothetical protein